MSQTYQSRIPMMANQIAAFFATQSQENQIEGIAKHINLFWEPRMRRQLFDYIADGGTQLHPLILAAADKIRKPVDQEPTSISQ